MKVYFKFILLLLISSMLFLNGCSKDDNPTSSEEDALVGTWVLTKIILTSLGNTELSPQTAGFSATIIMKSDKTFTANYSDSDGPSTDAGTWSVSGGKLILKSNDGTVEETPYTLSGNKFTLERTLQVPTFGSIPVKMEFTKQ
jgi:hypothetical protein